MTRTHAKYKTYRADQRQFFDELITQDWASYEDPWWDKVRRREVAALFRHVSPASVLDVGCGCGFHDPVLADQAGVRSVLGIDYSTASIEVAEREYPHPRVSRRVADIFSLDAGRFDLVVSFQVIEHLQDPVSFLSACREATNACGWVCVVTPNRDRIRNRYLRRRGRVEELVDPQHFAEYGFEDLEALGASAGLRPAARFAHGLTFPMPQIGRPLLPKSARLRAGELWVQWADVIGLVYRSEP